MANKTAHCKNGHEWTPETTYTVRRGPGRGVYRACKICTRARKKAQMARRREVRPEYDVWVQMRRRCRPGSKDSHLYYDRGVRVCDQWESFAVFLSDMGPRPSSRHSIDRVDNDGNYEPGNCRWATPEQQGQNQRSTKLSHEKAARMRSMRADGVTYQKIGDAFGVSKRMAVVVCKGLSWVEPGESD